MGDRLDEARARGGEIAADLQESVAELKGQFEEAKATAADLKEDLDDASLLEGEDAGPREKLRKLQEKLEKARRWIQKMKKKHEKSKKEGCRTEGAIPGSEGPFGQSQSSWRGSSSRCREKRCRAEGTIRGSEGHRCRSEGRT